ncbi:DUF2079 domain-containing protein [Streptomyces sp. NRRL WC-3742]|uniref:DUF2079 domain-containing protein n=1 Tax=Streptomyces sp. NRRL WC-3742 TaxID=1463934 RepID=UPI00068F704C|nr:DUF2079 domain-containing protein [Streptomyces sp. NRRL WC-3742]
MIDNLLERRPLVRPAPVPKPTSMARRLGPNGLGLAVAALFLGLYVLLSISRHERMLSAAFDLGIFEQAVRAYAHGRLPVVPLKGPGYDLLGDHFHPVLALLAPAYRLFPTPVTLLVAQASLMALACLPITRWAYRTAGPRAALVLGSAFGASWGIVSAVAYDFHEICFAVPLLAFAVEALGERRWRAGVLWALPLVLVKEDLGLTVAAVGLYVAWRRGRGRRGVGLAVAVFGLGATVVETAVLLPLANPQGVFDYWQQLPGSHAALPMMLVKLGWPPVKWLLLAMLAAPVAFVGLRSPLALLCLPTLAWRLTASNEHYWQPSFHYSAILMPILFGALLDVLTRRPGLRRRALAVCAAVAAVTTVVYPVRDLALPGGWHRPAHVRTAHRLLALIPDGSRVASTNRLAPILVARSEAVSLVCQQPGPLSADPPEWVVADATDPTVKSPCAEAATEASLAAYRAEGYRTVAEEDGILLLRR